MDCERWFQLSLSVSERSPEFHTSFMESMVSGGYFLVARLDEFVVELDVGAGVLVGDDEVDFAAFQCVEHGAYFEFPVVE